MDTSIVPLVISALVINPEESRPPAKLCTIPAVVKAGRVIVFKAFPIVTDPEEVPVLMLVAKAELLLRFIMPPAIFAPEEPVNKPAEVIVPVPVV